MLVAFSGWAARIQAGSARLGPQTPEPASRISSDQRAAAYGAGLLGGRSSRRPLTVPGRQVRGGPDEVACPCDQPGDLLVVGLEDTDTGRLRRVPRRGRRPGRGRCGRQGRLEPCSRAGHAALYADAQTSALRAVGTHKPLPVPIPRLWTTVKVP
jgi:hypothetical protein